MRRKKCRLILISSFTGLAAGCDLSDVEEGKTYLGKVQGFATFGMFVQRNDRIKGLVHKTSVKADHKEKDSVLVRVREIRPNGNIDLEEQLIQIYQVQQVERTSTTVRIATLPQNRENPWPLKERSPR